TLRPSQATKVGRNISVRSDSVNMIATRSRGACNKEVLLVIEGQMISGHTGFNGGKHKDLALPINFENRPGSIPHIKVVMVVERDTGGNAHSFGIDRFLSIRRNLVNAAIVPAGNKHFAQAVESDAGRIHQV